FADAARESVLSRVLQQLTQFGGVECYTGVSKKFSLTIGGKL
ncbi:MAG: hypothetical protein HW390_3116, partial [Candidatus Brocadiaceae bacterium]|nr:hypothetical protein [Candidatus Brocadiaceae bacterium]